MLVVMTHALIVLDAGKDSQLTDKDPPKRSCFNCLLVQGSGDRQDHPFSPIADLGLQCLYLQ